MKYILYTFVLIFGVFSLSAQNNTINTHLQFIAQQEGLDNNDISEYTITNAHTSSRSNLTHYYLRQNINQLEIFQTQSSIHVNADDSLFKYNNAFIANIGQRVSTTTAALSHAEVIQRVSNILGYDSSSFPIEMATSNDANQKKLYSGGSISAADIPIKLMYYPAATGDLKLCYDLSIQEISGTNWWSLKVDADTGEIVSQINWILECNYAHTGSAEHICSSRTTCSKSKINVLNPDTYNVYPTPVESPNHGSRTLEADPANLIASPFGWHDTNGAAGAESTFTRGNNVLANEDLTSNNNVIGYSPDGGANLEFNFPIDFTLDPASNMDASLTNLFYWNNVVHDVFYQYGFDEASGNFQENNYGKGGNNSDRVIADGLDGGGSNNANFATPPDGQNPRMQMYLWSPGVNFTAEISSPLELEGAINAAPSSFGPNNYSITDDIALADDGSTNPTEACNTLVNASAMNGKIALVDRGNCDFSEKILNAQNAGAIAGIICQNTTGAPFSGTGGNGASSVTIPSLMISKQDCDSIKAYLPNVTISISSAVTGVEIDGSFDNGIIVHEYGHGISNRLTGGSANSGCLSNTEQMGEGWSDWFGMVMTIEPGDISTDVRGVGTYATVQSLLGVGIRDFPYSTDMGIDPRTYQSIKTASVPHGVGSVWCAMLWDMTWNLIDAYGFDPDLHSGVGGNNIAMALVTEALKLQPCSPGFVSGRDAILSADIALYGGQNECLIWSAFAKRGLGDGASQGSTASRNDGIESYAVPIACANLHITKTVDKENVIAGDILTYKLRFDNQTFASFSNLVISDTLLGCLSYVPGSASPGAIFNNGVLEYSVTSVAPFTTHELFFKAQVEPNIVLPTQTFLDDVENGQSQWDNTSNNPTPPKWSIDNSNPYQGMSCWFAENPLKRSQQYLTLKSPKKITSTSQLKFWHLYSSLATLDGGKVEISTDNKNSWIDLASNFTQNGYDSYILDDVNNPAFGGANTTAYIESIADLSAYAGAYVYVRFTLYTSGSPTGAGWNIDNIELTEIEKTVDNIGYFTADPDINEIIHVFPPVNVISATCTDGVQNGNETGIDSGGSCEPISDCEIDITLSGNPAPAGTYQAQNLITSTANVGPNTSYFASTIVLENDFEVILGNEFLAEINPCTAFSNDDELSMKVISTTQINDQNTTIVDVNIPTAGTYLVLLETESGKSITTPAQDFKKGVNRISVETFRAVLPNNITIIKL